MLLQTLYEQKRIQPPKWLPSSVHYMVIMGSTAYGVSENTSDLDVYGFGIPPKEMTFPHLTGFIEGFDVKENRFDNWCQHHIKSQDGHKEYDFSIYSITRYFRLCMDNNPNMVDSLFVPDNCVLQSSTVGNLVRENRKHFLHKGSYHKFKGYAYQQMKRYRGESENSQVGFIMSVLKKTGLKYFQLVETLESGMIEDAETTNRLKKVVPALTERQIKTIENGGADFKAMYHIVRLMDEVEQILTTGDLDLQRNKEQLKAIRRGEWSVEKIAEFYSEKEQYLETVYQDSKLPHGPDEKFLKNLLLECLESQYGSLANILKLDNNDRFVADLQYLINKYK